MTESASGLYSIDEISRNLGIGKDNLRVWERRYQFPQPDRDAHGERVYSHQQLERLRLICRLLDQGYRPGKVVPLPPAQLLELADADRAKQQASVEPEIIALIDCVRNGDVEQLQAQLQQLLQQQPPAEFVLKTAAPLIRQTGNAWARGDLSIYMEHLITQQLSATLLQARSLVTAQENGFKVMLATLPGEPHGLGLTLVELLLKTESVKTLNLGTETPVDELVAACQALQPDALALSFSSMQKRPRLISSLQELANKIPASLSLLAGGEGICHLRALPERIQVVRKLEDLSQAIRSLQRTRSESSGQ